MVSLTLRPLSDVDALQLCQRSRQFDDPVGQQVAGVLHRATPQDVGRVQRHLHTAPFQIPRLPGQSQTGLEHLPHLVVQDQLGAKYLQRALGEGTLFHLNSQGRFPPEVKVGPGLGLGVAHLVLGLEQQGRRQQAGRHAVPAVVRAVELGVGVGTAGPAATSIRHRSFPAPHDPDTTGPLPRGPSGPNALPACSSLAMLVDPKYSRSPISRHFPARFLVLQRRFARKGP